MEEYCGQCAVCDDPLEIDEAGFCSRCGQPFCWPYCGGWIDGEHVCNNCIDEHEAV